MKVFTGEDGANVESIVKTVLRDRFKSATGNSANYRRYNGVDVVLLEELEADEIPTQKPLVTLSTARIEEEAYRKMINNEVATGKRIVFSFQWRVTTDAGTGGQATSNQPVSSGMQLSNDLRRVFTGQANERELYALGIDEVKFGERQQTIDNGLNRDVHVMTCVAYAFPDVAA